MADQLLEALNQQLKPIIDSRECDDKFSGTVFVSRGSDTLFTGAWGYACRPWKIKNALDTLFATASVAKIFTATAILQLIESGRLILDQPVHSVVPLHDSAISPEVTLYHLLTHTSGIGDYFPEDEEGWPSVFETTPTYTLRCVADFLPLFTNLPPRFAAGTRYDYCNAGYILLGRVIEVITGQSYFEAIRQQIFLPADMERACFPTIDTVCEQLSDSYVVSSDANGVSQWRKCLSNSIPPAPDGGLAAPAGELDRYWRALLEGRLLGAEWRQQMLTPQAEIRDGWAYGLGVYLIHEPKDLLHYEAHGFEAGVNAFMAHYPTLGVNVSVLSNLDAGGTSVYKQLHELIVYHAVRE